MTVNKWVTSLGNLWGSRIKFVREISFQARSDNGRIFTCGVNWVNRGRADAPRAADALRARAAEAVRARA